MVTTSSNIPVDKKHEATLSNAGGFTAFSFGRYNIRFKAPYSLERYVDVVSWDDGYLVVLAKYSHNTEPEEEYIDLKPILDDRIKVPLFTSDSGTFQWEIWLYWVDVAGFTMLPLPLRKAPDSWQ